jgi:hypothetical protein
MIESRGKSGGPVDHIGAFKRATAPTINAPAASERGGNNESILASCASSVWSSSDEVRGATPKGHAGHVGRNKRRVAVRSKGRGLPSHLTIAMLLLNCSAGLLLFSLNETELRVLLDANIKTEFIYIAAGFRRRALALCARCGPERAARCHMHTPALVRSNKA